MSLGGSALGEAAVSVDAEPSSAVLCAFASGSAAGVAGVSVAEPGEGNEELACESDDDDEDEDEEVAPVAEDDEGGGKEEPITDEEEVPSGTDGTRALELDLEEMTGEEVVMEAVDVEGVEEEEVVVVAADEEVDDDSGEEEVCASGVGLSRGNALEPGRPPPVRAPARPPRYPPRPAGGATPGG